MSRYWGPSLLIVVKQARIVRCSFRGDAAADVNVGPLVAGVEETVVPRVAAAAVDVSAVYPLLSVTSLLLLCTTSRVIISQMQHFFQTKRQKLTMQCLLYLLTQYSRLAQYNRLGVKAWKSYSKNHRLLACQRLVSTFSMFSESERCKRATLTPLSTQ